MRRADCEVQVKALGGCKPYTLGDRIRGMLGDIDLIDSIDPPNQVPFKRARSRFKKFSPLRGLPNAT